MKEMFVYDIEILGGNFFCATFINPKTNEKQTFYVFNRIEFNIEKLNYLITICLLIGYNNHSYDDIILNYIYRSGFIDPKEIQALSDDIIHQHRTGIPLWKNEDIAFYMNDKVDSLDLMKILAFDKLKVGLKQCAVNLRHPLIQDLPFPHDRGVKEEDIDTILSYNDNDVQITLTLLNRLKEDVNLRYKISHDYKVNVKNASRTYIAKEIFNKYYADYTGLYFGTFKELRTPRSKIIVKDCIQPNIKYTTPIMNKMLDYFNNLIVYNINDAIDYKVIYNNKGYQMGFGGIHSIDRPGIFESTEDLFMVDADVKELAS